MRLRRFSVGIMAVIILVMVSVSSVMAQVTYKVTLAPIFRPGVQLDTDGSDIRYVDVDLIAKSNIEYWTVQVNCLVNKAVLSNYLLDTSFSTANPGDDVPMFTPGEAFDDLTPPAVIMVPFNATTGAFAVTISRVNPSTPIGGGDVPLVLGTMRFQVKPQTMAAASTFSCTSSFLDRNGVVVAPVTYVAPAPLSVLPGYPIAGTVTYQGRTAHAGIKVTCGNNPFVLTSATGAFLIGGRTAAERINCLYEGLALHLAGQTTIETGQSGVRIPAVQLPAGNTVVTPATYVQAINIDDLTLVTSNFGSAGVNANTAGNTNGDTAINQADVALVTSNFGRLGPVQADHLLVSYARDYVSPNNKRAFLVNNATKTLTQAIAGNSKVYHATLSPDGSKVAYVSEVKPATAGNFNTLPLVPPTLARYALFVAPAPGLAGAPVRITAVGWQYDAFYPSWSSDGTTLAFVCSRNYSTEADWLSDSNSSTPFGNLCTINPSGQNLIVRNEETELFAPSWYNSFGLIYAEPVNSQLNYLAIRGNMPSVSFGVIGHMPIWRDNILYYVHDNYTTVLIASSANINTPFVFPTVGTLPNFSYESYHQSLYIAVPDIETIEVSDFNHTIYVKPFDSNKISHYQFNGDPVSAVAYYIDSTLLPQYAYVGCSCSDALNDRIDYAP